jgi:hypothetical protein
MCAEHTGLFWVVLHHLLTHRRCSGRVVHRSLSPVPVSAATGHSAVGLRRRLSFLRLVLCFHPALLYVILFVIESLLTWRCSFWLCSAAETAVVHACWNVCMASACVDLLCWCVSSV